MQWGNPLLESVWDLIEDRKGIGLLKVRVRGKSMAPSLRPNDVVIIEPVSPDELRPGDIVLFRSERGVLLHRFLGYTPQGWLLTQGDACISPDPPWPPEALLGKAVGIERNGQVRSIPCHSFRLKLREIFRKGALWVNYFLRLLFALAIIKAFMVLPMHAAVTLVSFTASPEGQTIVVKWETASEVNMLGFYLWRSTEEGGIYSPISDLIPAEGDIVGATYQFIDTAVEPGQTYFYKLEAVETTGASQFYGPVSATVPAFTPTPEPSPTSTPTPTSTFTPTPSPTSTPTRTPTLTSTPTPSPTSTPTPTFTPVSHLTSTPTPTFTLVPHLAPKPTPSPTSTLIKPPTSDFTPELSLTLTPTPLSIPAFTSPLLPAFTPYRSTPCPPYTPALSGTSSSSSWKLWAFLLAGGFLGCAMIFLGALFLGEARKRG